MNGSIGGMTGSLLTAQDPNTLLQQNALEQYESDHQIDAIGNVKSATVARSNADAAARLAVAKQRAATQAAERAKQAADAAVTAAVEEQRQLQAQLASQQVALQQAQEELATLNHERAAYIAYQRRQAAIRAARARARRLAAERAREAALRAAAAERRRLAAEAAQQRQNSGGSSGSSGGGGGQSSSGGSGGGGGGGDISPSGGRWTPQAGEEAAARALRWRGWMYAWAGGNAYGPTYGVCAGDGAFNDCHVKGFDCSGLSLYAWAPYISLDHYAAAQYWQAGRIHPATSQLRPGDLTFWSSNGSPSGIHHVAIYIGGGNVVQAPQSGSVIQVTPLWDVDWGYLGATRPLT
jgi:cell wall-associated NlpC family hydrolase